MSLASANNDETATFLLLFSAFIRRLAFLGAASLITVRQAAPLHENYRNCITGFVEPSKTGGPGPSSAAERASARLRTSLAAAVPGRLISPLIRGVASAGGRVSGIPICSIVKRLPRVMTGQVILAALVGAQSLLETSNHIESIAYRARITSLSVERVTLFPF